MPRLFLTKAQRSHLVAKFGLTPTTLHEIVHYERPECQRHAEIQNYAINELGVRVFNI